MSETARWITATVIVYYARPIVTPVTPNPEYQFLRSAKFPVDPGAGSAGLIRTCEIIFEGSSSEENTTVRSMCVGDLIQFVIPGELDITFRCENTGWEEVDGPAFVLV